MVSTVGGNSRTQDLKNKKIKFSYIQWFQAKCTPCLPAWYWYVAELKMLFSSFKAFFVFQICPYTFCYIRNPVAKALALRLAKTKQTCLAILTGNFFSQNKITYFLRYKGKKNSFLIWNKYIQPYSLRTIIK